MVDVYLSQSGLAVFKTALKDINKKAPLMGLFLWLIKKGFVKITGKKIPSLWGKNWDEIGVFLSYYYSYSKISHLLVSHYDRSFHKNMGFLVAECCVL